MATIADVLAVVRDPGKRATTTVKILLDLRLIERFNAADAALAEALVEHMATMDTENPPEPVQARMDEVSALQEQMDAAMVEFQFRAVSFREWADLLAAHPLTKEQKAEQTGLTHNPDTFPAAAVAASVTDPAMTLAEATELLDGLHPSQRDLLWGTCLTLNRGDVDAPKSRFLTGLGPRSSAGSGEPPTTSGSPDPSSSDG